MFDVSTSEWTAASDEYFNYCMWPYVPRSATSGKLRPVSLLYRSFALTHVLERGALWVEQLQRCLGRFRTVYGIKWNGSGSVWEFYFYDYDRRERGLSASRFLDAAAPLAGSSLTIDESLPYFMFSVDVDVALLKGQRTIDSLHLYLGNPGSTVSSGVSYGISAGGAELENFYFFFAADSQLLDAAAKIGCSMHFDAARGAIEQVLRPELCRCQTICIANKRHADTVYFSGVTVDQLLWFLGQSCCPQPFVDFVSSRRGELDHLLYDVGFDYTATPNGPAIGKSGVYGVF